MSTIIEILTAAALILSIIIPVGALDVYKRQTDHFFQCQLALTDVFRFHLEIACK